MSEILAPIILPIILMIIIVAAAVMVRKTAGKEGKEYDERQVAARGKAYRNAFLTVVWSSVIYAVIVNFFTEEPIANEGVIPVLIALMGLGVFAVSSIVNDAFLALNRKPAQLFIIFGIAAVVNGFSGVLSIIDGDILENGRLAYPAMQLGCAALFLIVSIVFAVKLGKSSKSEAEE